MRFILSLAFVALLGVGAATAQRAPMKWGDIPDEHLQMTAFPADSNAAAVVLGDYAESYFASNYDLILEVHRRVKLLRESSYEDFGQFEIVYPSGRNGARVRSLKAQTITTGADGRPVYHEVDRKSFFKEKYGDDLEKLSFAFPALEPGAIVEYTYKIETPMESHGFVRLPGWSFQTSEPVLLSEYRVEFPAELQYVVTTVGDTFSRMSVNEQDRAQRPGGTFVKSRWVMENVPALRTEPFMTSPKDYRYAVRFQLNGFQDGMWGRKGFLDTWEDLAKWFVEGPYREVTSPGREVREATETAVAGVETQVEKIRSVYDYVRSHVEYNGDIGRYPDKELKDVLKDGRANSPAINLLLVAMLREAGFTAHPVLLSTRANGRPHTTYPVRDQFNDMIAYVEAGGQTYLLDATDEHRPFDLLPYESLNGEVWVVRLPNPTWIPIATDQKLQQQRMITMDLDVEGRATGHLSAADGGYAALATRRSLSDDELASHDAYVRDEVFEDLSGLTVSNVVVTNPDDHRERVQIEADFTLDMAAQAAGDFLYLSPFLLDKLDENPLKAPTREFPVDMGYGREYHYVATITLPEGYGVSEVPPNQRFGVSGGGALYQRVIQAEGRTLQVMNRLIFAKSVFEPNQYGALREFYDRVVASQSDQVVIQRLASAPDEAAPVAVPSGEEEGGR